MQFVEVLYEDGGLPLLCLLMSGDWRGKDQQNLKRGHWLKTIAYFERRMPCGHMDDSVVTMLNG